jgi:RsiW-degrading membrane proteinase PrsW (M82 family)
LIIYSAILTLREFKLHRNSLKLIWSITIIVLCHLIFNQENFSLLSLYLHHWRYNNQTLSNLIVQMLFNILISLLVSRVPRLIFLSTKLFLFDLIKRIIGSC